MHTKSTICKAVEKKGRKGEKKKRKKSTRSEGCLQRRPEFRTMSFPAVSGLFFFCAQLKAVGGSETSSWLCLLWEQSVIYE